MRTENWKKIVTGCGMVLLAAYVGGFFEILFSRSEVCLSPLQCLYAGCGTSSGRKWSMAAVVLLLALTVLVIWRGKDNPLHDERNFEISDQGTYGTAGFMGTQEQKEILQADRGMEHIKGIIFGRELSNGKYIKSSGGFKTEPKYRGMRFARFHEIQDFRKSDGITVCAQG